MPPPGRRSSRRLGVSTTDVLRAARTKWNFLPFSPGLVGGHCIGVDPYYLTSMAEKLGYQPQVILAGRRINDSMGAFVAQRAIKLLVQQGIAVKGARVGILGLAFKENVPDLRNSRIPDIVKELRVFGVDTLVNDPLGDHEEAKHEYHIVLSALDDFRQLDGLILAVPHRAYLDAGAKSWRARIKPNGIVVDVKSSLDPAEFPPPLAYWRL